MNLSEAHQTHEHCQTSHWSSPLRAVSGTCSRKKKQSPHTGINWENENLGGWLHEFCVLLVLGDYVFTGWHLTSYSVLHIPFGYCQSLMWQFHMANCTEICRKETPPKPNWCHNLRNTNKYRRPFLNDHDCLTSFPSLLRNFALTPFKRAFGRPAPPTAGLPRRGRPYQAVLQTHVIVGLLGNPDGLLQGELGLLTEDRLHVSISWTAANVHKRQQQRTVERLIGGEQAPGRGCD